MPKLYNIGVIINPILPPLMKKSVKTLVLITTLFLLAPPLTAQLKLPVVNPIANDVKRVIADYPNRFINLMGEIKEENPQSTDYTCNFKVSGAEECLITRYSAKKEVCSWEALMLTTENFEKAKQKFKSLYGQLNNLSVDIGNARNVHLKAKYEKPNESQKFTSILFVPEQPVEKTEKLRIELTLQFHAPMEWKVSVLVYDRDREDHERGETKEVPGS
jgi:hypothetical protein